MNIFIDLNIRGRSRACFVRGDTDFSGDFGILTSLRYGYVFVFSVLLSQYIMKD
jgi:hypothetical protein